MRYPSGKSNRNRPAGPAFRGVHPVEVPRRALESMRMYAGCIPVSTLDSSRILSPITEYAAASAGGHSAESPEKQV